MGLLKPENRMSLAELLEPPIETECSMWTTDEIFRSVKDQDTEEDPANDDSDEPPPRPKPTAKEVFKAISLINDYIESDTTDAADKLNQSMELYSKQLVDHLIATASQKTITDFFKPINSD
jgi:hypothetical protein